MSGIPSWAVKGARVVCVGRTKLPWEPSIVNDMGFRWKPKRGEVYTVRETYETVHGWFIMLAEEPRPHGFHGDGFRPLVTIEDDLKAHFETLLHQPVPDKELAL